MPGLYPTAYRATFPAFFMRLVLGCFYCLCVFVYVLYFIATMSFVGYFLSVLFCLLSMLISDSRFDLVWFRLSCDHGWIRSGSVNVRKQQQQQQQQSDRECPIYHPVLNRRITCISNRHLSLLLRPPPLLRPLQLPPHRCLHQRRRSSPHQHPRHLQTPQYQSPIALFGNWGTRLTCACLDAREARRAQ